MELLKFNITYNLGGKNELDISVVLPKEVNGVFFKEIKINHEYPQMVYLGKDKHGKEMYADLIIEEVNASHEEKVNLIKDSTMLYNIVDVFFSEQEEERDPDPTDENGLKAQLLAKFGVEVDPMDYCKTYSVHKALKYQFA